VLEPPRYRIHALHDGDDAFRRGELETALDLYDRVVSDEELLDWPAPGDRRAELAAYASFRRVLAYLVEDASDRAQAELAGRQTDSSPTGSAFAELARRLLAAYANGALDGACAAAAPFIAENAGALLTPLDFGYENRSYTAADICPGALP
jgi:hypothetical protein